MSSDLLGSFIAIPAGQLVAGPSVAVLGLRTTLVIGAVAITTAVVATLVSQDIRAARPPSRPAATKA